MRPGPYRERRDGAVEADEMTGGCGRAGHDDGGPTGAPPFWAWIVTSPEPSCVTARMLVAAMAGTSTAPLPVPSYVAGATAADVVGPAAVTAERTMPPSSFIVA